MAQYKILSIELCILSEFKKSKKQILNSKPEQLMILDTIQILPNDALKQGMLDVNISLICLVMRFNYLQLSKSRKMKLFIIYLVI